jgi:hypothetical protein
VVRGALIDSKALQQNARLTMRSIENLELQFRLTAVEV